MGNEIFPHLKKEERMKYIKWRLRDLPSAEGVAALVAVGVLTLEEARFILLGETGEKKEETN